MSQSKFFTLSIDNGATFTDTIFEFNPLVSKTYTLNVIDSNSAICPANEIPLQVVVDNINDIELKTDKLGAYCPGETIIFSANDSIENFDFYYNNVLQQSGATNTYSNTGGANGDSVFVIVTKGQCTDTSLKNYVQLEIAPDASFTFARAQSVYTFTPTNGTFNEYKWDFGDGSALSTYVSPTHDYADVEGTTVNASLEIVTSNNCVYDSSQAIALPVFSSVADLIALGLEVYPNPTTDVVYINNEGNRPMQLTVISLSGEVVLQAANATKSLDVSKLSAGVYILKVRIGNEEA
ncbi:T9SS type A sorting domain-containing protein, partial [Bacteroidia bacterium]|nr:T9SS type A sorting domain-containing protein [Bacteroidia bacterium]